MHKNINTDFPNVNAEFLSPPFKNEFDLIDINEFEEKINKFSPDIIFVGLTAPKQEKLIFKLNNIPSVKVISGIGAVFDFYAKTIERPSIFWQKLHLEWFIRFIKEPRRMYKRLFISNLFIILPSECRICATS